MSIIKKYQGEDIEFALTFVQGTDLNITSFLSFDSIECEAWTSNYPVNKITLTVYADTLTGVIAHDMTNQMFGNVFMLLSFTYGGRVYKQKFALNIFIDKAV